MRIITLQREAICAGCGTEIPAGAKARYYSADKIYCETHAQDGEDTFGGQTQLKAQPGVQPPLRAHSAVPDIIPIGAQTIVDLITELGTLQASVHYLSEYVAQAKDLMATIVMLMREYKAVQNDTKDTLNQPLAIPKSRNAKFIGGKD
jgi:hypothetical protein